MANGIHTTVFVRHHQTVLQPILILGVIGSIYEIGDRDSSDLMLHRLCLQKDILA
jgi:hypothetical protein